MISISKINVNLSRCYKIKFNYSCLTLLLSLYGLWDSKSIYSMRKIDRKLLKNLTGSFWLKSMHKLIFIIIHLFNFYYYSSLHQLNYYKFSFIIKMLVVLIVYLKIITIKPSIDKLLMKIYFTLNLKELIYLKRSSLIMVILWVFLVSLIFVVFTIGLFQLKLIEKNLNLEFEIFVQLIYSIFIFGFIITSMFVFIYFNYSIYLMNKLLSKQLFKSGNLNFILIEHL